MSTSSLKEIWKLIEKFKEEVELLTNEEALVLLIYINRHEGMTLSELNKKANEYFSQPEALAEFLLSNTFIEERNGLFYASKKGKDIVKIIEYAQYDISDIPKDIIPGYSLQEILGTGSTSITFKAVKEKTGRAVALKILKPGILDNVDLGEKIKRISNLKSPYLVIPSDYGDFKWNGLNLKYIELEYIDGKSLNEFSKSNINVGLKNFLSTFILEVGQTLEEVQDSGSNHGDLHTGNILVEEDKLFRGQGRFHFKIIDFIGINSSEEFREFELTDFDYFKENLLKIMRKYATTSSGEIDRGRLGERFFYLYGNLVKNKFTSFRGVIDALSEKLPEPEKLAIIERPSNYLIFEQYDPVDPKWLRRFEPENVSYRHFTDFCQLICSGTRGCGKTIYLRSLSFIPKLIRLTEEKEQWSDIKDKIAYFKGIFGIYFPCRQGEFKNFSEKSYKFTLETQLFIKHIFILKIIRRTISLIEEAYSEKVFTSEPKINLILKFLPPYLMRDIALTAITRERPFQELTSILRNEENSCLDILGETERYPPSSKSLDERILIEFFRIIKQAISELADVKFYVIFDDVSDPQVSFEAQEILNCLMSCHNEVYCCKFSTEKYAYTYQDMYGKALQSLHDYTYVDLSWLGLSPYDEYSDTLYEQYLERIINKQLEIEGYPKQIKDYLQDLPYYHQELVNLLSKRESQTAKFAGWRLVVQLSSKTVRDGLALCEAIFREYDEKFHEKFGELKKGEGKIPIDVQDKAIRKYSREAYANLVNIEYLGEEIFNIVRNFGGISQAYLSRDITKEKGRKYEVITIERRDSKKLSEKAKERLRKLIRYSIFIDRGLSFSREQIGLVQKFTLHKKFTPALMITYREREHLRLSKEQLEKFLLQPDEFKEELLNKGAEISDEYQLKLFKVEDGTK